MLDLNFSYIRHKHKAFYFVFIFVEQKVPWKTLIFFCLFKHVLSISCTEKTNEQAVLSLP